MAQANWYNQNQNRCFPFLKGTTGVETPESGPLTMEQIPHDWIVDAGFHLGSESEFSTEDHGVKLTRIERIGDVVFFTFRATVVPSLKPMIFSRSVDDEDYTVEHVEIDLRDNSYSSQSESETSASEEDPSACDEPAWTGYLVTGSMASIAARLDPGDAIVQHVAGDAAQVEPGLLQNLNGTVLTALDVANADRTRCTAPEGCDDPVWPYETGIIYPGQRCVQGDVRLKPGYNCEIFQRDAYSRIVIGARRGAGEGEPCEEVPVFTGETPPTGASNDLLAGGLLCNEVLRSINGQGGPFYQIIGGQGVSVVSEPELHRVRVNVNMVGLSVCWYSDFSQISE